MYEKLGGMTGTAETEAEEFGTVYTLDVVQIPTNMPMVRVDSPDMIYRTLPEKWDATVDEIKEALVQITVYCGTPAGRQAFLAAHTALNRSKE